MRSSLSPFAHELDFTGSRCADDCPACHWVKDRARPKRKRPQAAIPSKVIPAVYQDRAISHPA